MTRTRIRTSLVVALMSAGAWCAHAQVADDRANPVYLSDAPIADETIERALALLDQGNIAPAARALDQLIDQSGDLIAPAPGPGTPVGTVRDLVHSVIVVRPELLEMYRRIHTSDARRLLESGSYNEVWRRYMLTEPGLESGLRRAQVMIERGWFDSGLMILEELLSHPDARGSASRALDLALLGSAGSERGKEICAHWSSISGEPVGDVPRLIGKTDAPWFSLIPNGSYDSVVFDRSSLSELTARPTSIAALTPSPSLGVEPIPEPSSRSRPRPWCVPLVSGDNLITNDGITVSCFDRYTLRERWRVRTEEESADTDRSSPNIRARIARTLEDVSTASISDNRVYVASGLARAGGRTGGNEILKIDLSTGAILARTTVVELDPTLPDASIRGPILVWGDTLILAARTNLRRERLVSLALVGIDKETLEHRWTRPIASAGSLPFQQVGQVAHSGLVDQGVVYWSDLMGVVCAVEAATGELVWARTMPSADIYARYERDPWTVSAPIVRNGSVYVLSVDGRNIEALDQRTGKLRTTTRSTTAGLGLYLIETPEYIGCVSREAISLHPIDEVGIKNPKIVTPTGDGRTPITGRVTNLDQTILMPIEGGLALVKPGIPDEQELITLESSGITLPLEGQLIVTDENSVISYLSWDTASRTLGERAGTGSDTGSAITLADLAARSGHHTEILPAVDRAIELIRQSESDRARLIDTVLGIVGLPGVMGEDVPETIRDALISRVENLARTPDQRLSHKMTRGAWALALGDTRLATRVYHSVLGDPSLRSLMWSGAGLKVRAEIESIRGLDTIVQRFGRDVCAPYDAPALAELEVVSRNANAQVFEDIARRYPWAKSTPSAWSFAAERRRDSGDHIGAARAARDGLGAVSKLEDSGSRVERIVISSLASTLVGSLFDSGRPDEAARIARDLSDQHRGLDILVEGRAFDPESDSSRDVAGRPDLGNRFVRTRSPALITGSPLRSPNRADPDGLVFHAPQLARAQYIRFHPNGYELVWSRTGPPPEPPVCVLQDHLLTVLLWAHQPGDIRGGVLECIDNYTGQTRWIIDDVRGTLTNGSARRPDPEIGNDDQLRAPIDGDVRTDQVLALTDGSVITLLDRIGRAAGIDLNSGRVMWRTDLPINRVHDADLRAGVLGVSGMRIDPIQEAFARRSASIGAFDPRTGLGIALIEGKTSTPRWIRATEDGDLIAGTNTEILAISTREGAMNWTIRNPDLSRTNGAWILGSTLFVLDERESIWLIKSKTGLNPDEPLRSSGRIIERGWLEINQSPEGVVSVAGTGGINSFDSSGNVIARDAGPLELAHTDAAWGNQRAVLISRARNNPNGTSFDARLYETPGLILKDRIEVMVPSGLDRQPGICEPIEGGVVIGFGEVSILVRTE